MYRCIRAYTFSQAWSTYYCLNMKSFLHREKNIYPSIKEYVSGPSSQRVFQFLHTHKPTINTHTPNRYEYRDTWNNVSFKLIFKTMLSVYYLVWRSHSATSTRFSFNSRRKTVLMLTVVNCSGYLIFNAYYLLNLS